jgi:hypothetical protein
MNRRRRQCLVDCERVEPRTLLSRVVPSLTMKTYNSAVSEIATAVNSAATTQDLGALNTSLQKIAAMIPHGNAQLVPIWNGLVESADITAAGGGTALDQQLVTALHADVHDDAALGLLHLTGTGSRALTLSYLPSPPFNVGSLFSVAGKNFPTNFTGSPIFRAAPQDLNGGRLKLSLSLINDTNGNQWIDMDFQNPRTPGSLAGSASQPWQAGPIGAIQLTSSIMLNNIFFYFTVNGRPVAQNLGGVPGQIYAGANPIRLMRPQIPQVFFFNNFRPGIARTILSLGTGISSGSLSYANFLKMLNVPSGVNGLHIDFWQTPVSS